jgi:hypothetical protein
MRLPIDDVRRSLAAGFAAAGLTEFDADRIADHFVTAEASGVITHGIERAALTLQAVRRLGPGAAPVVKSIAEGVVSIDGRGTQGVLVAQRCTELAVERASRHGAALVAGTRFVGSTGVLGYFTEQAARADLVAVALCNSEASVAPAGGIDPILGTNPLALSFPATPDPITLDIATAALSYGALRVLQRRGEPAPPGTVLPRMARHRPTLPTPTPAPNSPWPATRATGLGFSSSLSPDRSSEGRPAGRPFQEAMACWLPRCGSTDFAQRLTWLLTPLRWPTNYTAAAPLAPGGRSLFRASARLGGGS